MFTNEKDFGGDFGKEIFRNIDNFNSLEIASGYFDPQTIEKNRNKLLEIAKRGFCKILVGMIYHEGVSKNQKKTLEELNKDLKKINNESGVYITLRKYHGKIYKFKKDQNDLIFVGSSNFSGTGMYGNLECNTSVLDRGSKDHISKFLNHLFTSKELCANLDNVELTIKKKKKKRSKEKLSKYEISKASFPKSKILSETKIKLRVDEQPRSSLNLYFEKGRKNPKTGKYSPRPWYEVEITSKKSERTKDYPVGKFIAYVFDDKKYYKLNMITASEGYKGIMTKDNREILGEYIKGKLEREGHLERLETITIDTLRNYGQDYISLKKIKDKTYYLEF